MYTALISACSREILEAPASNRRLQLVLLERAQGVLVEMRNARLQTDPFLWNALIAAAGRAGQLQRAFQNMDDMQVRRSADVQHVRHLNCSFTFWPCHWLPMLADHVCDITTPSRLKTHIR